MRKQISAELFDEESNSIENLTSEDSLAYSSSRNISPVKEAYKDSNNSINSDSISIKKKNPASTNLDIKSHSKQNKLMSDSEASLDREYTEISQSPTNISNARMKALKTQAEYNVYVKKIKV